MTPTFRSAPNGFTLMEMLVVLAIMSIAALLIAPQLGSASRGRSASLVDALRSAIADAHHAASQSGRAQTVVLDGAGANATLTNSVDRSNELLVYPDRSTSGGQLLLDGRPVAEISWLTGEVSDASQ